jgi:4-aminobutyrate aminotransferase-like enzyme
MSEPAFLQNVRDRGQQLMAGLRELQRHDDGITQVRGLGLMVGTQFNDPARVAAMQSHCLHEGRMIVMNAGTYSNTLRWMPPLIVNEHEIELGLTAFTAALKATS